MREMILSECINLLNNHKFIVSQPLGRSCFDLIARKKDSRFLIKILKNIDSLSKEQSEELIKISSMVNAVPIIIGTRTRNSPMENGVVYERYNIKAITYDTFDLYLKGSPPVIYAHRGGFFVNIDGNVLKETREKLNISVSELAEFSRVSKKTIYKYEQNAANPAVEIALKIEEYLDVPLVKGIQLSEFPKELETEKESLENKNNSTNTEDFKIQIMDILGNLGFNLAPTRKAPFDAVAEKHREEYDQNILLTNIEETETAEIRKKALIVNEISKILNSHSLLVLEKKERYYKNLAVISMKELEKMDDAVALIEYIKEMIK
ncbi:MAG: putative transcriptional regulator [Methanothermococcus sp.]|nr:putative transcriptional regulator [Methanothermococcus sp.]